ncbi:unnamed protein product [Calicophoron daubneyi]|uniref:PurM-like C-terminal domain-containing protein n=1 Tax=Calicophoron daubneyi TaxID=300641 RepID=A0AAV2T1S8_CALDB
MGWITCCNVLSDMYAMGVVNCDNMLLVLGVCQSMSAKEQDVTSRLLMEGFRDCALEAGTFIRGGQTIISPWSMIGGVATSVCLDSEYIMPNQAELGDVLVLTKPLGTQVAVNCYQWMIDKHKFWTDTLQNVTNVEHLESLLKAATLSMAQLNRTAAQLMHKYHAHGCTDVTGFGLLGHANNLARVQLESNIGFKIHTLPCLEGVVHLSTSLNDRFNLMKGLSPETSGGLLVLLPAGSAPAFCQELTEITGCPSYVIGEVIESKSKSATLVTKPHVIEVNHSDFANSLLTDQQQTL